MPSDDHQSDKLDKLDKLDKIDDMRETTVRLTLPRSAQPRRKVLPTIRVVAGRDMLSYVTLPPNETITIGRDETCDLRLTDVTVSSHHAKVVHDAAGSIQVVDLNSTNGSAVNGDTIRRAILRPGDHLEIAAVSLRLDLLSHDELGHLRRVVMRLEAANRDPLTGLLTRAFLMDSLPDLSERCAAAEVPFSCIFIDIDRFHDINAQIKHVKGDEVLCAIARIIMLGVRDNDPAVRYGGDEMCVFLPGSDEAHAMVVAERIRRAIAGHDWERTAPDLQVTASFGAAERQKEQTLSSWIDHADRAAYMAKNTGRNRVCIASELPPSEMA